MAAPELLVTGATGATGHATVVELRKSGHTVRALVRTDDARAALFFAERSDAPGAHAVIAVARADLARLQAAA